MFLCIKNAEVYTPAPMGRRDVLLCAGRVIAIAEHLDTQGLPGEVQVLEAAGKRLLPGLIDQHVHITGGGGERGFTSRVPELRFFFFF